MLLKGDILKMISTAKTLYTKVWSWFWWFGLTAELHFLQRRTNTFQPIQCTFWVTFTAKIYWKKRSFCKKKPIVKMIMKITPYISYRWQLGVLSRKSLRPCCRWRSKKIAPYSYRFQFSIPFGGIWNDIFNRKRFNFQSNSVILFACNISSAN